VPFCHGDVTYRTTPIIDDLDKVDKATFSELEMFNAKQMFASSWQNQQPEQTNKTTGIET